MLLILLFPRLINLLVAMFLHHCVDVG
ncbi:DUF3096 domain-containing protein [Listeria monocytogenes]|nr:DUF3096 domain-containing protein [Listeria monocytogenes]EHL2592001.1 DUF3096 domain-containing protein [Listeria monocytogenes]EIY1693348.1 DUF3096 domain-containing protein [Listeria monocytogenes]NHX33641.1 DUF3096 domain-containing protein [Escherichia coli]